MKARELRTCRSQRQDLELPIQLLELRRAGRAIPSQGRTTWAKLLHSAMLWQQRWQVARDVLGSAGEIPSFECLHGPDNWPEKQWHAQEHEKRRTDCAPNTSVPENRRLGMSPEESQPKKCADVVGGHQSFPEPSSNVVVPNWSRSFQHGDDRNFYWRWKLDGRRSRHQNGRAMRCVQTRPRKRDCCTVRRAPSRPNAELGSVKVDHGNCGQRLMNVDTSRILQSYFTELSRRDSQLVAQSLSQSSHV